MKPEDLLARIRVVLCRPSHPGNIGAVARAMKTMGLSDLWLVEPRQFPDAEADARATGAVDLLQAARVVPDLRTALADTGFALAVSARPRELGPTLGGPREGVGRLLAEAGHGPVAMVFGNETYGLSNLEMSECQAVASIPTNPDFSSLNLGSAAQVLCYECRMSAFAGQPPLVGGEVVYAAPAATHREIDGLLGHLERVMTDTGFYNPAQPGRLLPKLQRLFARARLESEEVNILRGLLAATQKPTGHGRKG